MYKSLKHCRWCGTEYYANYPNHKDGFCSVSCKQAHYRAYKRYITHTRPNQEPAARRQVTRKTA
jgi:hypothetical protein